MKHLGTAEDGETVGGSSGGVQLSPGRGSSEMISDGRTDANGKVFGRVRRREPAANGPSVVTLAAGPSGSGSMSRTQSYLPVLRHRHSSGLGREVPRSDRWRRDVRKGLSDAQ
jgi:hypothetical protein